MGGGAFGELRRGLKDDTTVVVAIPSLCVQLLDREERKGAPLTVDEVLQAVDAAPAITMLAEHRDALDAKRGFPDLDPDNVWADWLEFRAALEDGDD